VGDLFLIIVLLFLIFRTIIVGEKIKIVKELLPFLVYVIIITFFFIFNIDNDSRLSLLLRSGRYIAYLFFVVFFIRSYFDLEKAKSIIKYVSIFATIWILVQYLGIVFLKIYIPGHLLFLPITRESVYSFGTLVFQHHAYIRPRSIFDEPSEFGLFCGLYLFILLRKSNITFKNFLLAVFITVGIIVSTSMIGLVIAGFLWIIFLYDYVIENRFDKRFFILLFILIVSFIVLGNQQLFGLIDRITSGGIFGSERFDGILLVFNVNLSKLELLFGKGMIDYKVYGFMPAFTRLILYFGLIGFSLLVVGMIKLVKTLKFDSRIILIVFIVINTIDILFFGKFNLIYWALILTLNEKKGCVESDL
jgi:hypothetical protein